MQNFQTNKSNLKIIKLATCDGGGFDYMKLNNGHQPEKKNYIF